MTVLRTILRRLRTDLRPATEGATALEYGLLGALIAVAVMGSVQRIGPTLNMQLSMLLVALRAPSA